MLRKFLLRSGVALFFLSTTAPSFAANQNILPSTIAVDARVTSYAAFAALGAKPAGFLVNCPVVSFGD
jgi:hypothetical protein